MPRAAAAPFALKSGDHVVTYGDSITEQKFYSNYVEAFTLTRFPQLTIDWTTAGWGGDKVTGGEGGTIDVRLQRDVLAYNPTMVTVMLGMNDGGYRAFDPALFDIYAKGYQHIIDVIKAANPAPRMSLLMPSPFDEVTRPPLIPGGYNPTLVKYGEFVRDLGQKNGFMVADLNGPVVNMLQKANAADPALAQTLMKDRVHASPACHLIMAESVLKSWNFPATVSAVTLNGATGKLVSTDNTTVTNIVASPTLAWDQLDKALPLPVAFADPLVQLVLKSSDFVNALDKQTITVTGLPAQSYALVIDGQPIGTFTRADLAAGVNLATLATPMLAQANQVQSLTDWHVSVHARLYRHIPPYTTPASVLDDEDKAVVVKQRAAAIPVTHHFELRAAN
jgi:lysophospholipase L1-like esterase